VKLEIQLLALIWVLCFVAKAKSQDLGDHLPMSVPSKARVESAAPHPGEFANIKSNSIANEASSNQFAAHFTDLFEDQKRVWTSPAHVHYSDATWLVPLGGLTAGLFATDRQYSASLPQSPSTLRNYRRFSNAGVAALAGTGAGLYLFSYPAHNSHWRETGFLAGEAALNGLITVEALKYSFQRERPFQGGSFFQGGSSFPSAHSAVAWSIAGVIGHEYSGTIPKLLAYGVASAVSFSRVRSGQHFPSDVLIGSALGYLIAQNMFRRRHDPELGGGEWLSPREVLNEPGMRTPSFMGSPYVPLDSWIYPAIERLSALGYVKTDSMGMRPWTRLECARLINEATVPADSDSSPQLQEFFRALSSEFTAESVLMSGDRNLHVQLESIYQRSLAVSGAALADGYHFGQTVLNDFGRPLQQGLNNVSGTSAWAVAGPFVIYARGEYQYAPSAPAPSQAVLDFISNRDYLPANALPLPINSTARFHLLEAYVGMNLRNWQVSFGKESLWWGPSAGGAMAFTDNAAPLNMFRVDRVAPFRLPGIFGYLGDLRLDFFVGQLSGQEFVNNGFLGQKAQGRYGQTLNPQPFLSGARISFKFTQNLEFNMSKTTIYGGPGNPLTPTTLLKSALDMHQNGEPLGDGRSAIDFSYRIPKLRDWFTFYGEGFTEDEVSPLVKPGKSVWQGGLYLSQVPKLNRLDMRIEGGFTSPVDFSTCNGCFYHNFQYVNGFTNAGQLMGTWVGRAAQGESMASNYWLGANKKIGIEIRHRKIDSQFLPRGGTQNDAALKADLMSKSGFSFSGTLQYELWQIPLLSAKHQSNVMASFQLGYWPRVRVN
jgi:hypothetical protein